MIIGFAHAEYAVKKKDYPSLVEILFSGEKYINSIDTAVLNLLCSEGLPGTEHLNINKVLNTINQWTDMVKSKTDKSLSIFYRSPETYRNSIAYFKILVLVTVLEKKLNIRYNPDLISKPSIEDAKKTNFFYHPKNVFLYGVVEHQMGSCASLPILIASVGRRLGYPLKLVMSKAHLFLRWEDDRERFNIEAAGNGLVCHPDDYYKTFPFPLTQEDLQTKLYLNSFSKNDELALFLEFRGFCLQGREKFVESQLAFVHARHVSSLFSMRNLMFLKACINREEEFELRIKLNRK